MAPSLYNKYRPQTFDNVVGQQHVERTLENAVTKGSVSHAYLFTGPRGTGKTTTARILAKALLCVKAPTTAPDGSCEECRQIAEGTHPDVYELDAASRTGVDNVREEIIGRVHFAPTRGRYKIYIIDEVHMLSTAAFNALLKTLEEPPSHVVFVLCTTDVHKVPDTVQARCQRFDFKRLGVQEIVGRLQYICEREGFDFEPEALELVAQRSAGGMRDAIRSLEQVAVFSSGNVRFAAAESLLGLVDSEQLFALCEVLAAGDVAGSFAWVSAFVQGGSDLALLAGDLALHVRNMYAVSVGRGADEQLASALELDVASLPRLRNQAAALGGPEKLAFMLTVLGALGTELKNAANARLALEVALTRIMRPATEQTLEALAVRVAALEAQLAGGASAPAPAPVMAASVATAAPAPPAPASDTPASDTPAVATVLQSAPAAPAMADSAAVPVNAPASDTAAFAAAATPTPSAAAAAPTLSASAAAATPNAQLLRQWDEVVDLVRVKKRGVAASLGGIQPSLDAGGDTLFLALPKTAQTSRDYLEIEDNKRLVANSASQVFGKPLQVRYLFSAQEEGASAQPWAEGISQQQQHPQPESALLPQPQSAAEPQQVVEAQPQQQPQPIIEQQPQPRLANEQPQPQPQNNPQPTQPAAEPSKESLESILSASVNTPIRFEEQ